jgi:glutathione S-transferase
VQVALEEIGVPYERVWVGEEPAEVASFRELNPTGKVPALRLPDGTHLFESAAMLIHLALVYPEAKLAPAPGTTRHARFLQWMVFMSANLYESVLRIYYSARFSSRGDADGDAIREQGTVDFLNCAGLIGRSLNPYVLGAEYSIADAYLYMLAGWYPDKAELHAQLPALGAHAGLMRARPAIAKVDADHATHAAQQ